ncbi:MAG: GHKL domain-containing protein [Cyanobacteria bacterium HKST-UBA06]|nr:GHKL domain-containing protein [Cyanobacteria bacterium HKST-UBA06]
MVFLDIGEQLLIESVLQQCPLGVLLLSITNAELLWRNQMATTLLGAHASIGETFGSQRQGEQFLEQIRNDKPFYHHIEDGGFVFVPQTMTTPDGSQGVCIVWMIPSSSMDVDLANLQRDWLQQRKLATVGQMIVEMVHELSNPLSSISMGTQLIAMSVSKLQQRLPKEELSQPHISQWFEKIMRELTNVSSAVQKASKLREELLAFSKPSRLQLKPVSPEVLIRNSLNGFINQPLFRRIAVETEFAADLPQIMCDAEKVEQIVYNLLKNAAEAMEGKGMVELRVFLKAGMVTFEFEDHGPGIDDAIIDNVFSPFSTTKKETGNGLGLSICRDIIGQHGGSFSVYNTAKGACFQMRLPSYSVAREKHLTGGAMALLDGTMQRKDGDEAGTDRKNDQSAV